MIHSVRLDRLPSGLQFPAEFASKISYSEERRQLQFDGFMSKTDFDKLVRLHSDLAYQRALERLFQTCTFQPPAQTNGAKRVRGGPIVVTGLATLAFLVTMVIAAAVWWR